MPFYFWFPAEGSFWFLPNVCDERNGLKTGFVSGFRFLVSGWGDEEKTNLRRPPRFLIGWLVWWVVLFPGVGTVGTVAIRSYLKFRVFSSAALKFRLARHRT